MSMTTQPMCGCEHLECHVCSPEMTLDNLSDSIPDPFTHPMIRIALWAEESNG